ncbi:hypothetical protein J3L18_27130 [Mucilaginibacter gossypii]|uniref:hypothetical protein n=1 Tax=Mucilaginibacter gossypii TaxID=551996 RepID=UPI001673C426|nr:MULTISPECIES: hypothetical protein [Mucilaginibacter]QTE36756.1 hypothetical protein J3L18_27130 [Mucilaginibacter gossypii]
MEKLRINTMITGNEADEAGIFLMIDYAAMLRLFQIRKVIAGVIPFAVFVELMRRI